MTFKEDFEGRSMTIISRSMKEDEDLILKRLQRNLKI